MSSVITPHDVALCVLLRGYLSPGPEGPSLASPLRPALGQALLSELRSNVEGIRTPSLEELLLHCQAHLGSSEEVADYKEEVWMCLSGALASLDCPDALVDLFGSLGDLVTSATSQPAEAAAEGADGNSAMGMFLRRIYAASAMLSFEATCRLLGEVQRYFGEAGPGEQGGFDPGSPSAAGGSLRAPSELEAQIVRQLKELERQAGRLPRGQLEAPLAQLQAAAPQLPATQLARHLSSLHHRDFAASLDYLHRYFDQLEGRGEGAAAKSAGRLQSASLSLGAMHARFGHVEEAMQALNETVRIAQQNSDDTCLAHALASLCQILEATTPGTITSTAQGPGTSPAARHLAQLAQLLRRCLRRSEELQLPHLVAFARLALARFDLLHHPATPPPPSGAPAGSTTVSLRAPTLEVGAAVRDVAQLHLATVLSAAAATAPASSSGSASARVLRGAGDLFTATAAMFGANTAGMQGACAEEVAGLAGSAHLLRAAAWELCGSRQLGQAHLLSFLRTHAPTASAEAHCGALAQLAVSLAASHGPAAAEQVLAAAQERFPHSESRQLARARLAVAHDWALHRRDLQAALGIASQMAALASPTDTTAIDVRLDAEERIARTLLACGQLEPAARAAHTLFAMAVETGQALAAVRLLLLLARVHQAAGAPVAALPYALACATHCRQLHADLLGAEAALVLGQVWGAMGAQHAERAQQEVEGALPLIMAHGSLDLRSRAQLALSEMLLGKHRHVEALRGDADWALELLEGAEVGFKELGDWQQAAQCCYLRALACDALELEGARNAAAAQCCALQQQRGDALA